MPHPNNKKQTTKNHHQQANKNTKKHKQQKEKTEWKEDTGQTERKEWSKKKYQKNLQFVLFYILFCTCRRIKMMIKSTKIWYKKKEADNYCQWNDNIGIHTSSKE